MAMKKRFLPALMAGMVVVGSTGLANADSDRTTVIQNPGATSSTTVHITGTVETKDGQSPAGKLIVELPTRLAFSVDKNGDFTGASYQVTNRGKDAISVSVSEFQQIGGDGNINLVSSVQDSAPRGTVELNLEGNIDKVNLRPALTPETKILVVQGGKSAPINLTGKSGRGVNDKVDKGGAVGEYNMIFKVSKHETQPVVSSSEK